MTPTILWLVGEPGAGKTTLARTLLDGQNLHLYPKPKWTIGDTIVAAGHYTGKAFDGGDTVPYSGARAACWFWYDNLSTRPLTIFDGDRFSSARALGFFRSITLFDIRLACALVTVPPELGAQRRSQRGTQQSETWVKGRVTKSQTFFEQFHVNQRIELDGKKSPSTLAMELQGFIGRST